MRKLLLLALLPLAACFVKAEGRRCATSADCPDGQGCGYDLTCSRAAASCADMCWGDVCSMTNKIVPCVPDADGLCAKVSSTLTSCSSKACALSGQVAACTTFTITKPTAAALLGSGPQEVDAELAWDPPTTGTFVPPPSVALTADSKPAAVLVLSGSTAGSATYVGSFVPTPGVDDGTAVLQATALSVSTPTVSVAFDTLAPRVALTLGCATSPCQRDGTLQVTAVVTDAHPPSSIDGTLALGAATAPVTLSLSGTPASGSTSVSLQGRAFPSFAESISASANVTDAAGNAATASASSSATRLRWGYPAGGSGVTSPAADSEGDLVMGLNATASQLVAWTRDGGGVWTAQLQAGTNPTGAVLHAPAAGTAVIGGSTVSTVWAASGDGRIYLRTHGATAAVTNCPTSSGDLTAAMFGAALIPISGSSEQGFAGGAAAKLYWADTNQQCAFPAQTTTDPLTTEPVIVPVAGSSDFRIYVATGSGPASIRQFVWDPTSGLFAPASPATPSVAVSDGSFTCDRIDSPMAVDGSGNVLVGCGNGELFRIDGNFPDASVLQKVTHVATVGAAITSLVVTGTGDLVAGAADGVHRVGATSWSSASTDGITGLALGSAGGLYATTAGGRLLALRASDGSALWSSPAGALGTQPLDFPTILPPVASENATLYVGSADGQLRAIAVDEGLDGSTAGSSPWPKYQHDVRNTGNQATPVNGP